MNLSIKIVFFFLFCQIVAFSQGSMQQSTEVDFNSTHQQIIKMIESRPDFFYSKIQTEISSIDRDLNTEIKLSTRVKKDSLIFSNASYMGIQAASVQLTKEKGVFLNRFSKCYSEGDAKIISDYTGLDFELLELEELILGLPVYYTKLDVNKILSSQDSSKNVRVTFSGNLRTNSSEQKWIDLVYLFNDSLNYMKQLNFAVPGDSITLVWKCEEFQDVSGFRLPEKVSIVINKLDSVIELNLKYNAVEINVPEKIEFEIPENYEKCK